MRYFKLALVSGVLAWLAACSTAPPSPAAPAVGPPAPVKLTQATQADLGAKATQGTTVPGGADARGTARDVIPNESASGLPRPALLAGEFAREYQRGGASWYGPGFHGRRTASGERYDMNALTAAHRTLPFGTLVRVHSLVNGREVEVRITDRGPFIRTRVIDLSRAAADMLGMLGLGFKEVVLLVPESTPVAEDAPLPAVTVARGSRAGKAGKGTSRRR